MSRHAHNQPQKALKDVIMLVKLQQPFYFNVWMRRRPEFALARMPSR